MSKDTVTYESDEKISFERFKKDVLADYRLACISRETSLLGRKEVLTGKAKFGIFGDGKELAQLALAKSFKQGDFRSGYYRDQTLMFAIEEASVSQFFSQLYADTNSDNDVFSSGRQMNAHFSTKLIDQNGNWLNHTSRKNSSADTSPTSSQMTRSVGLALASKVYRENKTIPGDGFSSNGDEVVFATIGDASTSEGLFWESVNAAGVLKIPLAISIWDDGYGISVPKEFQTTKGDISTILKGFQVDKKGRGFDIYVIKGWDYASLCETYEKGIKKIRETHIPAIFHIIEVTQPQGHSTSGSHERYKSAERLKWESEYDCINKMREWLLENNLAGSEELVDIESEAKKYVKEEKNKAWKQFLSPIKRELNEAVELVDALADQSENQVEVEAVSNSMRTAMDPIRKDIVISLKKSLLLTRHEDLQAKQALIDKLKQMESDAFDNYSSHLYSESAKSALQVETVPATYSEDSPTVNGFEVLNKCFDELLAQYPEMLAFGEDLGKIGDVNQGFAGLQEKHGDQRVFDTGIREATIIGQGIGLAMRGLRPISEIQYLDYLIFGLQPLVDDLATLQYRTKGTQKAPLIVRTRGHRLEGIWHTGSPMGMVINALRGMFVLVPRNMTQAAGFYNTLMQSDDPALVVECLNGYRLKERVPDNLNEFRLPLGIPEVLIQGEDVTLVTYGSCIRIAEVAIQRLNEIGISVELIDVQTLIPFDINHMIVNSLEKTSRIVFMDEDVPGGASAFMFQQVMELQKGYYLLDSEPRTISAKEHRSAYGSDGDYFSKPNAEEVFEVIYDIMHEADPSNFPVIY